MFKILTFLLCMSCTAQIKTSKGSQKDPLIQQEKDFQNSKNNEEALIGIIHGD